MKFYAIFSVVFFSSSLSIGLWVDTLSATLSHRDSLAFTLLNCLLCKILSLFCDSSLSLTDVVVVAVAAVFILRCFGRGFCIQSWMIVMQAGALAPFMTRLLNYLILPLIALGNECATVGRLCWLIDTIYGRPQRSLIMRWKPLQKYAIDIVCLGFFGLNFASSSPSINSNKLFLAQNFIWGVKVAHRIVIYWIIQGFFSWKIHEKEWPQKHFWSRWRCWLFEGQSGPAEERFLSLQHWTIIPLVPAVYLSDINCLLTEI